MSGMSRGQQAVAAAGMDSRVKQHCHCCRRASQAPPAHCMQQAAGGRPSACQASTRAPQMLVSALLPVRFRTGAKPGTWNLRGTCPLYYTPCLSLSRRAPQNLEPGTYMYICNWGSAPKSRNLEPHPEPGNSRRRRRVGLATSRRRRRVGPRRAASGRGWAWLISNLA